MDLKFIALMTMGAFPGSLVIGLYAMPYSGVLDRLKMAGIASAITCVIATLMTLTY